MARQLAGCAVGRLDATGAWVGFDAGPAGYELVVGAPSELPLRRAPAEPDLLIALAVAHFSEGLDAPPEEIAATHADIAELVRHLAAREANPSRRAKLELAVDAIDDGLPADAVIGLLDATLPASVSSDPVAVVRARARVLAGNG